MYTILAMVLSKLDLTHFVFAMAWLSSAPLFAAVLLLQTAAEDATCRTADSVHPLRYQRVTAAKPPSFAPVLTDDHLPVCTQHSGRGGQCNNCAKSCSSTGGTCTCSACGKCNDCEQCACCVSETRAARSTIGHGEAVAGAKKPKLLFAIANWVDPKNPKSLPHFRQMLHEIARMVSTFDVHLVVYSTADVRYMLRDAPHTWEVLFRPAGLRFQLTHEYRDYFAAYRYEYDLYVYQEDDQLLTKEHLLAFVDETKRLREADLASEAGRDASGAERIANLVPGFYRMERSPDDHSAWVNFNTEGGALPPFVIVGGEPYFSCKPPVWCYSGGMVATRRQLHRFLQSRSYHARGTGCPTSTRETAAEELYCTSRTNFVKVVPLRRASLFQLHHLANKDISKPDCRRAANASTSGGGATALLAAKCDGFVPWGAIENDVAALVKGVDDFVAQQQSK